MGVAVAVCTECKPATAALLHSQGRERSGMLQHPKGLSLPLGWSRQFSFLLALTERNTLCSLTFVPFGAYLSLEEPFLAAGGIG